VHTLDKAKQGRAGQVRAGLIILFNGTRNTESGGLKQEGQPHRIQADEQPPCTPDRTPSS